MSVWRWSMPGCVVLVYECVAVVYECVDIYECVAMVYAWVCGAGL